MIKTNGFFLLNDYILSVLKIIYFICGQNLYDILVIILLFKHKFYFIDFICKKNRKTFKNRNLPFFFFLKKNHIIKH